MIYITPICLTDFKQFFQSVKHDLWRMSYDCSNIWKQKLFAVNNKQLLQFFHHHYSSPLNWAWNWSNSQRFWSSDIIVLQTIKFKKEIIENTKSSPWKIKWQLCLGCKTGKICSSNLPISFEYQPINLKYSWEPICDSNRPVFKIKKQRNCFQMFQKFYQWS